MDEVDEANPSASENNSSFDTDEDDVDMGDEADAKGEVAPCTSLSQLLPAS
jgi:hypothetical protein